jgi:hypothetical protein
MVRTAAAGSEDLGAQVRETHGGLSSGRRAFDGRLELQSGRWKLQAKINRPALAMGIAGGDGVDSGGARADNR